MKVNTESMDVADLELTHFEMVILVPDSDMILLSVLPPFPITLPTSSLCASTFSGTTGRGSWNFL